MRQSTLMLAVLASAGILAVPALSAEGDARAIEANIVANHLPFGGIVNPVYASSTSTTITGYTRCADSALWTGAYLAAESYHYAVDQSPTALANVKSAIAAIQGLVDVTGDNRLARCMFAASWQFAAGIESEESANTINMAPPWVWVDHTSRDEVVGVFFGLATAYDFVNDPGVHSSIGPIASRIAHYISDHLWSPGDDITTTFLVRPEELQMLLDTTRHVNPGDSISGPLINPVPFDSGVLLDIQDTSSYFKFNLDYMTFFNLVRYNPNSSQYLGAYVDVRNYTANHQNPFFDMIDHALRGANNFDTKVRFLLDQWLLRPKRDLYVDDTKIVKNCSSSEACLLVPVPIRPTTDFLWQRDPFQLAGGGYDTIEGAGVDYILPYWMGRYYGVIPADTVQSAAAFEYTVPPDSIASIYGINLAAATASAPSQPLPTILGGASLVVTDANGNQLPAPLLYVSPTQINFVVPNGAASGNATFTVTNGATTAAATGAVQPVAPALFSTDASGTGVAAATALQTQAGNPQMQTPVAVYQCGDSGCSSVPIAVSAAAPVYASFYGTGIRNLSSLSNVSVSVNGVKLKVLYAGPAPGFTGLDQVNVLLDPSLSGAGEVNVVLTVDGQTNDPITNPVTINIQ
ncbi:MAG TPA: hypothetical protein VE957_20900 [Terriglobales bacterium]|nr:hypothetical protein [Terriglobales bacterium]